MAQYQVPQFIEVEDKIFGPLTLKQFIYLAGSGGLSLVFFTLLPILLSLPLIVLALSMGGTLAFYKVNGRPAINAAEHAFSYFLGNKLYLWRPRKAEASATGQATPSVPDSSALVVPRLSQSKLKDLSWSLNIKEQTLTSNS